MVHYGMPKMSLRYIADVHNWFIQKSNELAAKIFQAGRLMTIFF